MKRCKDCLLFDQEHWWCHAGSDRDPKTPACEWFIDKEEPKEGK